MLRRVVGVRIAQKRRYVRVVCSAAAALIDYRRLAFHPTGKLIGVPAGANIKCIDAEAGNDVFAFRKAHTDVRRAVLCALLLTTSQYITGCSVYLSLIHI